MTEKLFCPNCDGRTLQEPLEYRRIYRGLKILRRCLQCGKGVLVTLSWEDLPYDWSKSPLDQKVHVKVESVEL